MKNYWIKKYAWMILAILLLLTLVLIFICSTITGYSIYSLGGNVDEVNVSKSVGHWQALYGEIFEDSQATIPSFATIGGETDEFNITLPCIGNEVYASISRTTTLLGITNSDTLAVDNYLQLSSDNLESGSSVFTTTSDFVVKQSTITNVPTTYMKVKNSPGNTTFSLGILNESNNLVFVSDISSDAIGFDGETHDYQLMLPVNQSTITYYFFSDCAVSFCGDGNCDSNETCSSCPQDCGICPTPTGGAKRLIADFCGDGICQEIENCSSCSLDCGFCPIEIPEEEIIIEEEKIPAKLSVYVKFKDYSEILKEILFTVRGILILILILIVFLISVLLNKYRKERKKLN